MMAHCVFLFVLPCVCKEEAEPILGGQWRLDPPTAKLGLPGQADLREAGPTASFSTLSVTQT